MSFRSPFPFALLPLLGALGCITINLPSGRIDPLVETTLSGGGDAKVLLLEVDGVITESAEVSDFFGTVAEGTVSRLREEIELARKDPDIEAVVLRINSPGGTVTGSDLVYDEVRRFKADRGLPVVAQLMGTAASGGYYVALAADEIRAERTAVTGSIGVIFTGLSLAGLMEKVGVEDQTLTSGAFKDAGSMLRRMRPEERAQLQTVIDDLHARFVEVLRTGREELSAEQVRAVTDGRIFSAGQALERGLVDAIGSLDEAVAQARKLAGVKSARVVTYHRPREYANNLYTGPPGGRDAPRLGGAHPLAALRGPAFLYLWAPGLGLP